MGVKYDNIGEVTLNSTLDIINSQTICLKGIIGEQEVVGHFDLGNGS